MSALNRYDRQMILPDMGAAGQARLSAAQVLVVGAGGLGCPVLSYLAGAGVGRITILDPDHVEESNLHRQPLYRMSDLGRPKATAARDHLRALNPDITVLAMAAALHPDLATEMVAQADLVIDAADSFAVSYILSDACLAQNTALISASALGQSGYVGAFCQDAPSLRAVFPDLPAIGASCATAGVLGPVVGSIGSLQAQLALRVLLGTAPSPMGQMVTLDLAQLRFGGFDFRTSPEPACPLPFLSTTSLQDKDHVIELRSVEEAPIPITPTAQRIPPDDISRLTPTSNRRIVLACASGLRAWRAGSALRGKGHGNLALIAASACQ